MELVVRTSARLGSFSFAQPQAGHVRGPGRATLLLLPACLQTSHPPQASQRQAHWANRSAKVKGGRAVHLDKGRETRLTAEGR